MATTAVLVVLFALVGAPYARACDCMPLSFDEAVENADLVAEITVLKRAPGGPGEHAQVPYYATVNRIWKGDAPRLITFSTAEAIPSCGLGRIPDGETLVVWAYGSGDSFSSSWCSIPVDLDYDQESHLTRELGEPRDLTDQPYTLPSDGPFGIPHGLALALPVVAVLLVVGVGVLAAVITLVALQLRRGRR